MFVSSTKYHPIGIADADLKTLPSFLRVVSYASVAR